MTTDTDAIDDLFEVRAKQAADRLDLIGDLRPIAEDVDLWVAAIDLLREELGEGHAALGVHKKNGTTSTTVCAPVGRACGVRLDVHDGDQFHDFLVARAG